jgi:hypothetical protein
MFPLLFSRSSLRHCDPRWPPLLVVAREVLMLSIVLVRCRSPSVMLLVLSEIMVDLEVASQSSLAHV